MNPVKIPGGFDQLFRQITPLFLLLVIGVVVFEPVVPGGDWLRANLGETIVLRLAIAGLGLYVLLLWGESLRLNAVLTGVLKAFREHGGPAAKGAGGGRDPRARLEAVKLLIAALSSDDAEVRETSRHNLGKLAGKDLGADPGPWREWLAEQEKQSQGK